MLIPDISEITVTSAVEDATTLQEIKSYKLDTEKKIITTFVSGKDLLVQDIMCILNTERNMFPIYSYTYGSNFSYLIGKQEYYALPMVDYEVRQALESDVRILDIESVSFKMLEKGKVDCTVVVNSIYGTISANAIINI